jgi:hypothetical protein
MFNLRFMVMNDNDHKLLISFNKVTENDNE